MTTLREAAQMALDALEHGLPIIEDFGGKEQLQLQHKTIAVLYEALRAALAQPEQEPVAWCFKESTGNLFGFTTQLFDDEEQASNLVPLYTAPPQRECAGTAHDRREWQGLTDEERKEIIRRQKDFWGPVGWELECAKAIEAKLKEKNGL